MQIGIVTPRYPPAVAGGGEISVKLLADQLAKRGDEVTVYSFDSGDVRDVDGIPVHRFRSLPHGVMEVANGYAAAALWRHRKKLSSLDILHAYNVTLTPAVGWVSSKVSVPCVATLNSYDLLPKSTFGVTPDLPRRIYETLAMPTTGRVLRAQAKRVNRFITLSEASKQVYEENGFDTVPVDVVPNMVDPTFAVPDAPENNNHDYELLYVGSLIKEKGVSYLVRAMAELPSDVTLRIVGSGDQKQHLQSLAADLGVNSRIEFTGHLPYEAVRRSYASADCFVHPGVWPEPFGRTILEAMQAGLPVVATDIGGPAEVVQQPELRCEPRDPSAIADAVETARQSSVIGAANKVYVMKEFTPEEIVNRLYGVYERAMSNST